MIPKAAAAGGLSAIALSATWDDISFSAPTTTSADNGDRTLTFTGAARDISASVTGDSLSGGLEYRIDGGSWATYSTAFSVTSGQTVGWRINSYPVNSVSTVNVSDASRGVPLDSFTVTISGF